MFTPSFGAARAVRSLLAGLVLLALIALGCSPFDPTLSDTADASRTLDALDALAVDPPEDAPSADGARPSPDVPAPPSDTAPSDPPDVPVSMGVPVVFADGGDAALPQDVGDDGPSWLPTAADVAEETPDDVPPGLPLSTDVPSDLRDDRLVPALSMDVALDVSDMALPDVALDGDDTSSTYDARVDRPWPDVAALPDTPPVPGDASPQCTSSCDCPLGQLCLDGRCASPPVFSAVPPPALARNQCADSCQCQRIAGAGATCMERVCRCLSGGTWCDTRCVDTANDPANCGYCGRACDAGQTCVAGVCVVACLAGQTRCGARCVDTRVDAANCGACGAICAAGTTCVGGRCQCTSGRADCDGRADNGCEANVGVDPRHCGACGNACVGGSACTLGACVCPPGSTFCRGACVDLQTTAASCGACGIACAAGQQCIGGRCVTPCASSCDCPLGQQCFEGRCAMPPPFSPSPPEALRRNLCTDSCQCARIVGRSSTCDRTSPRASLCTCPGGRWCDARCVDTATDRANCGYCGRTCSMGQTCVAGVCTNPDPCTDGQTQCAGRCVDTSADTSNCGACGRACSAGERCVTWACRPACATHCDCRLGQLCEEGACITPLDFSPPTPPAVFRNQCRDTCQCQRFAVSGAVCAEQMCRCPSGGVWCDSRCVDTATDPTNCGQCGLACAPDAVCRDGSCQ